MARRQRLKSETGIYHIMLRGINKQQVFFDDDDYNMFLRILSKTKTISGFKLHAYCLMSNHIHLLIEEGEEPLSKAFKRIGDGFVYWYNKKYDRCGPIFQGRYLSVPVNDDEYYITVLKYIHQNPVKAGIVDKCSDYEFSSYNSYFKDNSFVNTGFALELIGINEFEHIHAEMPGYSSIDSFVIINEETADEKAFAVFEGVTHCKSSDDFKKLPKNMQKAYVKELRMNGFSISQVTRIAGVSQRMAEGR